ncbi:MAG: UDP-N-acetylmuramate dehydrogenase [Oscillospiraceae bacterium]|jgi:UDP-N-acetylmuramate dehydrogenase
MSSIELLATFLKEKGVAFERDVKLKERCTFRIGGAVDLMAIPADEGQIKDALQKAWELSVPTFVLGRGSNILCSDEGFRGMVIHLGKAFAGVWQEDEVTLSCQSGLSLAALCEYAQRQGLTGLEFAYGIPGTVGGAIYMNAGAYGGEMKDVLISTRHLIRQNDRWEEGIFTGEEMQLSYRHSAYSDTNMVITGATLRLKKGDPDKIRAQMDDYMNRRRSKQPLELPSAGSTFKRPKGNYASALVDQCGLKGLRVGDAMVSEKHAGFVVNVGEATCSDVLELIRQIQQRVEQQTGYHLEREVKLIGSNLHPMV